MYRGRVSPAARGKCPKDKGGACQPTRMDVQDGYVSIEPVKRLANGRNDGCPAAVLRTPFAFGISPVNGGNPSTTPPLLTRFNGHVN